MMFDPETLVRGQLNGLIVGLVSPRPIAWVSTLHRDGARNLAPFSFFNAFSFSPPVLAVGPGSRSGTDKDSLRNIRETGEFTVSIVTEALSQRANLSSGDFPPDVDEWGIAGVTAAPADDVRPPWVAESPAAFECRVMQIIDLGNDRERANGLVIASVTRIHVQDDVLDGLVPNPERLRLVGRMGEADWCTTRDRFPLRRPRPSELGDLMRRGKPDRAER
jgi:flavin reductase (DIM6/NTAB) family NADH-FMN oxidoreductase RutF